MSCQKPGKNGEPDKAWKFENVTCNNCKKNLYYKAEITRRELADKTVGEKSKSKAEKKKVDDKAATEVPKGYIPVMGAYDPKGTLLMSVIESDIDLARQKLEKEMETNKKLYRKWTKGDKSKTIKMIYLPKSEIQEYYDVAMYRVLCGVESGIKAMIRMISVLVNQSATAAVTDHPFFPVHKNLPKDRMLYKRPQRQKKQKRKILKRK